MKLAKKKRVYGCEINMAPLIDVVFLLIIFFMCVSQFTRLHLWKLNLPEASEPAAPEAVPAGPYIINLSADGKVMMGGANYTFKTLEKLLKEENRKRKLEDIPAAVIRSDRKTNWRDAARVMRICSMSRISQIRVAVTEKP